jgi:UDP-2-acetamido-3-amino-2,3-dideoxy-glucuronate N-acetyltransferase
MTSSYNHSTALIGCGDWGKNIARTLGKMGALSAIVDPSERAKILAKDLKVSLLTLEDVLADASIKGVVIATPTPTHFSLAMQALESGKHVFVEKPLVTEAEEIDALQKMATEKRLTLMVGHLLLYHKAFQKLVSWVRGGKLGDLVSIETHRKNLGKIHPHEGVLWDLGPHDFSMVLSLLGSAPTQVLSYSKSHAYKEKPDVQSILLQYDQGPFVQVNLSRLHPVKEQKITISGTAGMAVFDDTKAWEEKLVFYPSYFVKETDALSIGVPEKEMMEPSEPLREEMTHFVECCANHAPPLTPAAQAKEVLSIIHAAENSEETKSWSQL